MRAILLGPGDRPNVLQEAEQLRPRIEQHAEVVLADFTGHADLSNVEADVAIVLGGDGSILRAAHQMGYCQLPVIAVNLGRLGFLADLSPDELIRMLQTHTVDDLHTVEHLMFHCRVTHGTQVLAEEIGLNEVAVQTGPPFALMDVDLYVDSELVTAYSCDGLIVATPVGSTAHSLSAGGPILRKDLQAFVISPISPHTLTNRPVVDSADRRYEMVVTSARNTAAVVLDGRVLCTVSPGDSVHVQRAEPSFRLVAAPGHSYYRTLREKLGWGGGLRKTAGPPEP